MAVSVDFIRFIMILFVLVFLHVCTGISV